MFLQLGALVCTKIGDELAIVLLTGGVFGIVADRVGTTETIGLLGLFCLAGAVGATRLEEVTNQT